MKINVLEVSFDGVFKMSTPSDKRQITNPKLNFLVQKCNIMSNEKRSPHPICRISPFNLNEHF